MQECPNCHFLISFDKVSDLYTKEVRTVCYEMPLTHDFFGKVIYYGSVTKSSTELTPLGQKVCPPQRPFYYGMFMSSEEEWWFSTIRVVFSVSIAIGLWRALIEYIETANKGIFTYNVIIITSLFSSIGFCAWFIKDLQKVISVKKKGVPLWRKALEAWYTLYYCPNCECVFTCDDKKLVLPVKEMKSFLMEASTTSIRSCS